MCGLSYTFLNTSQRIRCVYIIHIYIYIYIYIYIFLQKNRSQKLSMLEKNKDSFGICIKFRTKLRIPIFDYCLIFFFLDEEKRFSNKNYNYLF